MTDYTHYTLLADGQVTEANPEFGTVLGPCIMAMKVWATDPDQAADIIVAVGERLGFRPEGELQVFVTEPEEPPEEQPFGYDVQFTSYSEDEEADNQDEPPQTLH